MRSERELADERRRHERFLARDNAYAMVTPISDKRGEIIDISRGGLSLQYISEEAQTGAAVEIDLFLHIFLKDISFCLLRIPVKTVSDFEIGQEDSSSIRRRSVVFGSLSQSQLFDLEYFIENHTMH